MSASSLIHRKQTELAVVLARLETYPDQRRDLGLRQKADQRLAADLRASIRNLNDQVRLDANLAQIKAQEERMAAITSRRDEDRHERERRRTDRLTDQPRIEPAHVRPSRHYGNLQPRAGR